MCEMMQDFNLIIILHKYIYIYLVLLIVFSEKSTLSYQSYNKYLASVINEVPIYVDDSVYSQRWISRVNFQML